MSASDLTAISDKLSSVVLEFSSERDLTPEFPAVQQWWVRAVARDWEHDGSDPAREVVADMHIVKGALMDASLDEQLDAIEGDLETVASALLDPRGELLPTVPQSGLGSSIVILNSVQVSEPWRGHGVGVMLAGMALQYLSDDAICLATFPAPLDGSKGKVRERAIKRLGKVWGQLGFEPLHGGVWVLDPGLVTLDNAVVAMRERFGLALQ